MKYIFLTAAVLVIFLASSNLLNQYSNHDYFPSNICKSGQK